MIPFAAISFCSSSSLDFFGSLLHYFLWICRVMRTEFKFQSIFVRVIGIVLRIARKVSSSIFAYISSSPACKLDSEVCRDISFCQIIGFYCKTFRHDNSVPLYVPLLEHQVVIIRRIVYPPLELISMIVAVHFHPQNSGREPKNKAKNEQRLMFLS